MVAFPCDRYVIKNVGWNYEIAPDASVSFGYTLSDYSSTNPDKFELCAKRVDKTDGYDVQYNITNEWDTGLQGEIVITNTSEEPLEAWELSFDSTFAINNLWYCNDFIDAEADGTYLLEKDAEYTIWISADYYRDYEIIVNQDNWIRAENGGLWSVERFCALGAPLVAPTEKVFITPRLLLAATIGEVNEEYTMYECYSMDDVNKIMAIITYDDPDAPDTIRETAAGFFKVGGIVLLAVGVGATIIASAGSATPAVVVIAETVATASEIGGTVSTLYGGFEFILTQLDTSQYSTLKNRIIEGNLSIVGTYTPSNSPLSKSWDVWQTAPYINKFQGGNIGTVTPINVETVKSWLPVKSK